MPLECLSPKLHLPYVSIDIHFHTVIYYQKQLFLHIVPFQNHILYKIPCGVKNYLACILSY